MANDPKPPGTATPAPADDNAAIVRRELRRRGMTEAEIDTALRKKKRRKLVEFDVLKTPHLLHGAGPARPRRASAREPKGRISAELCTVDEAAAQLQLHPRTVLRFIREGRLPATRVGKSYRIQRSQLEAFAGLPERAVSAGEAPSVTSIVDIPAVGPELAKRWARTVSAAVGSRPGAPRPLQAEVIYEAGREHLKIVVVGAPEDTINLLALVRVWLGQLGG